MEQATIKIKGHTYRDEHGKVRAARRGETIEVTDEELERGLALGAFVTDNDEPEESAAEEFSVVDASDDEVLDWLETSQPNVQAVVDAADGDPENAKRLLAAENTLTGNDPRKGVEAKLTAIIEG